MGGLAITLPGEAVLFSIKAVITRGGGGGGRAAPPREGTSADLAESVTGPRMKWTRSSASTGHFHAFI